MQQNVISVDRKHPYLVIGGGGHAKVLIDTLLELSCDIIGYTDIIQSYHNEILGVSCIGNDDAIFQYNRNDLYLVNGIGSVGDTTKRRIIFETYINNGYDFPVIISSSAMISRNTIIGKGTQIMRGAIIQTGVSINENCIINTGASIDHDSYIGNNVHIAPGAVLSGGVRIGDNVHIGTGAVIIQGIEIGNNVLIAAGSVVVNNVDSGCRLMGVPAKVY